MTEDLATILKRCLSNGGRADWEHFMQLVQPVVAAGVLRSVSRLKPANRELVDDLVQETFLKLCDRDFRILRSFRSEEQNALHVYLKTIASSVVIDHFRSRSALKKGAAKTAGSLDDVAPQLAVHDRQFAELERRELLEHVEQCLKSQESSARTMFWLYHRRGLTPKAIASLPGVRLSSNGVETAVYRLTKSVRECLRKAGLLPAPPIREGNRA